MNFVKHISLKITAIIVAMTFLVTNSVFADTFSADSCLRKPFEFQDINISSRMVCLLLARTISEIVLERDTPLETLEETRTRIGRPLLDLIESFNIRFYVDNGENIRICQEGDGIYFVIDQKGRIREERPYHAGDILPEDMSLEEIRAYLHAKGVKIIDKRRLLISPERLPGLRNLASILAILPPDHLPGKIIFDDLVDEEGERFKGQAKMYSRKGIEISYYTFDENKTAQVAVHEIGHTFKKEIQEGFLDLSLFLKVLDFMVSKGNVIMLLLFAGNLINLLVLHFHETLIGALSIMPISAIYIYLGGVPMKVPKQVFAEEYRRYVLEGDKFRERAENSKRAERFYQYMKERIFGGREYTLDTDGRVIIARRNDVLREYPMGVLRDFHAGEEDTASFFKSVPVVIRHGL